MARPQVADGGDSFPIWRGGANILNFFSDYLINGTVSRKKITEHKIGVLIFSTSFV
jgi:hypothetical protein